MTLTLTDAETGYLTDAIMNDLENLRLDLERAHKPQNSDTEEFRQK